MKTFNQRFDEVAVLHQLHHMLPAQAPLKDFVHHNTLHAFQHLSFELALNEASTLFGYHVYMPLNVYREAYRLGRITEEALHYVLNFRGIEARDPNRKGRILFHQYDTEVQGLIGQFRAGWEAVYQIDLDDLIHPLLFRILCSYLDQGVSIRTFPNPSLGFLESIRALEKDSFQGFFSKNGRAQKYLMRGDWQIHELLNLLVGDESWYAQYLFDQQFAHPGWSGMVAFIEHHSESLLKPRKISLKEMIIFELLLELDRLDEKLGLAWKPLALSSTSFPERLEADRPLTKLQEDLSVLHEAYEWSYYQQILSELSTKIVKEVKSESEKSFQALFCIDDRECSIRRHMETLDPDCETFGTPGFFNIPIYYKPYQSKYATKVCPGPITPKHLIKEIESNSIRSKDFHYTKHTHHLVKGGVIAPTFGFLSAVRLALNVFNPKVSPATTLSFSHMHKKSALTIENTSLEDVEDGLQVGFTVVEMADRVEGLLKGIGLLSGFAPIIYVIGHGASSTNNTHYAGYDCGACSGRPGSVNARVFSFMANHLKVREALQLRGIHIPETTCFIGALHDTTRDEVVFYDDENLTESQAKRHVSNQQVIEKSLKLNAKERSHRFELINSEREAEHVHENVLKRSVALFEPRPELNHATNALCIVGSRSLSKYIFLDRRAFLNSYDYRLDPEGTALIAILQAATPVSGGINLEYYFSKVENNRLGAGSKLSHNVMGLIGVANGIDGDLRTGLPTQMIEVHDPVRMMFIVEQFPEVILKQLQSVPATYEWYKNNWVYMIAVHPITRALYRYNQGKFEILETRPNQEADLNLSAGNGQEKYSLNAFTN
jgi:uncharacterized protein YbcC (UPF0753/DUF2309 family)